MTQEITDEHRQRDTAGRGSTTTPGYGPSAREHPAMINLPAAIDRALKTTNPAASIRAIRTRRDAILDEILAEAGGTYRLIRVDERGFDVDPHIDLGDGDDGIAAGITRREMLGQLTGAVSGEKSVRYRGERIFVLGGPSHVTVVLDEIGNHLPLVADTMSLQGGLALMRDLDQLIDYLHADPVAGR